MVGGKHWANPEREPLSGVLLQKRDDLFSFSGIGDTAENCAHVVSWDERVWICDPFVERRLIPSDPRSFDRVGISKVGNRPSLATHHTVQVWPSLLSFFSNEWHSRQWPLNASSRSSLLGAVCVAVPGCVHWLGAGAFGDGAPAAGACAAAAGGAGELAVRSLVAAQALIVLAFF